MSIFDDLLIVVSRIAFPTPDPHLVLVAKCSLLIDLLIVRAKASEVRNDIIRRIVFYRGAPYWEIRLSRSPVVQEKIMRPGQGI